MKHNVPNVFYVAQERSRIASNKTSFDMSSGRDEEAEQAEKERRWEEVPQLCCIR